MSDHTEHLSCLSCRTLSPLAIRLVSGIPFNGGQDVEESIEDSKQ